MTEAEWRAGDAPGEMLRAARPAASDRKMRLFAAACWFRTWAEQMAPSTRAAVELFVGHVDGTVSPGEWFAGFSAAGGVSLGNHFHLLIGTDALLAAVESARFAARDVAARRAWEAVEVDVHAPPAERTAQRNRLGDARTRARAEEEAAQAALVREVVGYPFRAAAFDPDWRTGTAVSLAAQMYAAQEFSAMPILADALQDAGCDDEDVLNHCRTEAAHVRGCWVLDLVLGKP